MQRFYPDPAVDSTSGMNVYPPEDAEKYDLCLVFPTTPREVVESDPTQLTGGEEDDEMGSASSTYVRTVNVLEETATQTIESLQSILGSRYIYIFLSSDKTRVIVLLRGGLKLLKHKAEQDSKLMVLNADKTKNAAVIGNEKVRWKSLVGKAFGIVEICSNALMCCIL